MKNTKMMKILNEEMAKFDDVSKLEEVKETVTLTMNDAVEEIKNSAQEFASTMSLTEMGLIEVTDEVRMSVIATMIKGAIAGAVVEEITNQLKEIDSVIEFNKEFLEESKVTGFAEKETKDEDEAKVENEDVFEKLISELIIGALIEGIENIKKEVDGEA
ncbi:TPA: hypothetical protein K8M77_000326 [Clostridium perfringens]|nr:hypothetical protein [Clostridium perfringens]